MRQIVKLLSRLPLGLLYPIGDLLALIGFGLFRYRSKVIDKNLLRIMPEATKNERQAVKKRFQRYFAEAAVETLKGFTMTEDDIKAHVTVQNPEVLEPLIKAERSLLILTAHQTNVEWLVSRLPLTVPCPVVGIYKPLHSPLTDELIKENRSRFGEPVPMGKAPREILKMRKSFRCMILAADQSPISREKRYWSPFFGELAPFYYGPQTIAETAGCAVVFAHPRRLGRGKYSIRFELITDSPAEKGSYAILDSFIDILEQSIREQPESWWLSNKKWKKPKPGELERSVVREPAGMAQT